MSNFPYLISSKAYFWYCWVWWTTLRVAGLIGPSWCSNSVCPLSSCGTCDVLLLISKLAKLTRCTRFLVCEWYYVRWQHLSFRSLSPLLVLWKYTAMTRVPCGREPQMATSCWGRNPGWQLAGNEGSQSNRCNSANNLSELGSRSLPSQASNDSADPVDIWLQACDILSKRPRTSEPMKI